MLGQFFKTYRFEHPKTEQSILVGGWSYVWAGLFGAFWVLSMGFGKYFLRALATNIGFLLVLVVFVGVTSYVKPLYQLFALVLAMPTFFVAQGVSMVSIVRTAFRRRGWMTRIGA
ncbi:MAG: hypothetical protein ACHQK9_02230 [Reyranellales bacterium]